jgi:hypothetical protein
MKSKVVVLLVGSLLATSGWTAEKNRAAKEESIGVGSGAAIGAIAGGPVGLIIGAAFGGWLGDRFHHERSERLASERQVGEAQAQTAALQTRLGASERAIGQMDAELYNERVAHRRDLTEALSVEVFFRTEDSGIAADTIALTEPIRSQTTIPMASQMVWSKAKHSGSLQWKTS